MPIHNRFVLWFKWMFANICVISALPCMFKLFSSIRMRFSNGPLADKIIWCYLISVACSMLACFITGAVFRFSKAGAFVSKATDDDLSVSELQQT